MFLLSGFMLAGLSFFSYFGTVQNVDRSTKYYSDPSGTTFPDNSCICIEGRFHVSDLQTYGGAKNTLTYDVNNLDYTVDFVYLNYDESTSGFWLTWNVFGRYNYILNINLIAYTSNGTFVSNSNPEFLYLLNNSDHVSTNFYFEYSYNISYFDMKYTFIPLSEDIYNNYSEYLDNDYYQQGYENGYNNGYDSGFEDGIETYRDEVYDDAYQQGFTDASDYYYDRGFADGELSGMEIANRDALIANQIFTGIISIALVPVNFFLGILNFDVFGINIGALVSSLLTVLVLVTIIKTIFGNKSGGTE